MQRLIKTLAAGAGIAGLSYATYAAGAWSRYGRPRRARGASADPLFDTFMPHYEVCERHQIAVAAPADVTFAAAREMELASSRIVRAIFKARELVLRSQPDARKRPTGFLEETPRRSGPDDQQQPDRALVGARLSH